MLVVPEADPERSPPAVKVIDWLAVMYPGPFVKLERFVGNVAKVRSPRKYCAVVPVVINV
jgi:hypothetical protein